MRAKGSDAITVGRMVGHPTYKNLAFAGLDKPNRCSGNTLELKRQKYPAGQIFNPKPASRVLSQLFI